MKLSLQDLRTYRPSVIALVAANLVPLLGVMGFGWSVFEILAVYWAENVVIGAVNVLKMITCVPNSQIETGLNHELAKAEGEAMGSKTIRSARPSTVPQTSKLFIIPFFIVHYGMFCFVHGVFVFVLFGSGWRSGGITGGTVSASLSGVLNIGFLIGVLGLTASHLYSFFHNYLAGGEYRTTSLTALMFGPYGRVVVLHLAILLGGFATLALGRPLSALLVLVVGKTVIDIKFHLRQHRAARATMQGV